MILYIFIISKYQILLLVKIMGIDGLLALLKPLIKKQHISNFKGKTIGVDALPWLYKGCYSDVIQMDDEKLTNKFTYSCSNYLLSMLRMLEQHQIKPILVFDGRSLNMKGQTIKKRQNTRGESFQKGEDMLNQKNCQQARKHMARSIRIQEPIIIEAMSILKTKGVDFLVAPYESDSQLAKLRKIGVIDAVITEDSDLLVYGCNVLYKLDEQGMCEYVDLAQAKNTQIQCKYLKSYLSLDPDSRICAGVLAGCDYVQSIRGIGIKKAIKLVQSQNDAVKLIQKLAVDKVFGDKIPDRYLEKVINAIKIFKHALVYNPKSEQLQSLNYLNIEKESEQQLKVIGSPYQQYTNMKIYQGQVNPRNLQPREIKKIEIKESQQEPIPTKLAHIKSHQIDEEESSNSSVFDNNMMEAVIFMAAGLEQRLWPFHQNLLNSLVNQILPP